MVFPSKETVDLQKECILKTCDWDFEFDSEFNNYDLGIWKCRTCGLLAQNPRGQQLEKLYDEDYYSGSSNFSYMDERKTEKFQRYVWKARLKNIQKFATGGNFLDIGCSFGGLLDVAKEFGFSTFGIEISTFSSKIAHEKGHTVFTGNLLDSNFPEKSFSVITLIEVIEHLENPKLVFEKLSSLLKPGGLLVIQTANFEGLQAVQEGRKYHYFLPGHIYYYSESNLKEFLSKTGFHKFKSYFGVDFGVLAKLLKSRGNFKTLTDYFQWFKIIYYHFKSKLTWKGRPLTSSFVLYSLKR